MNHYVKTTLASVFAVSLLAGSAMAQSDPKNRTPSPDEQQELLDQGSTGSINSDMTDQDIGGWSEGQINVIVVSTLRDNDPNRTTLQDRMKTNPDDVAALQSSIQNNPALKAQLESQNVQLNNIVAAQKSADGSVTFYVK